MFFKIFLDKGGAWVPHRIALILRKSDLEVMDVSEDKDVIEFTREMMGDCGEDEMEVAVYELKVPFVFCFIILSFFFIQLFTLI